MWKYSYTEICDTRLSAGAENQGIMIDGFATPTTIIAEATNGSILMLLLYCTIIQWQRRATAFIEDKVTKMERLVKHHVFSENSDFLWDDTNLSCGFTRVLRRTGL